MLWRARIGRRELGRFAWLLLPLLLPVLWVELAREHSVTHAVFVYRTFVLFCVLPMLAALAVVRQRNARTEHQDPVTAL